METIFVELDTVSRPHASSYIDALHRILAGQEWITNSRAMVAGMTAAAFRFTVDRQLTAESTSAYNWMADNFVAADLMGLTTSQDAGFHFEPTFPLYQKQALRHIRRSLDRGMPCIMWHDQFVVVTGYDDAGEELYLSDKRSVGTIESHPFRLPYAQFGRGESPYWYYQIIEDRIALDEIEVYRESLVQAVFKWETPELMLPKANYACGASAYDAIIAAFRSGEYDLAGAGEVLSYYAAAKQDITDYIAVLERYWPELHAATSAYRVVVQRWDEAVRMFTALGLGRERDSINSLLADRFEAAKQAEERAVQALKHLMRETVHNRFDDIGLR